MRFYRGDRINSNFLFLLSRARVRVRQSQLLISIALRVRESLISDYHASHFDVSRNRAIGNQRAPTIGREEGGSLALYTRP